jgi:hypothetical protein
LFKNSKVMFEGTSIFKFNEMFKSDLDCYLYLADIKWKDQGYKCKKCLNISFCKGKSPFSRRCTKCKYDESATSGTMFHKLKFSILKAFHMAFRISARKKGMSSCELSREVEIRQKTCWAFKIKLQEAMASSQKYPLDKIAEVDEFFVGGHEPNKQGRSADSKKKKIVIGLENLGGGKVGRMYCKVIKNASSDELGKFFELHIGKNTEIKTDGWKGYTPLMTQYEGLSQEKSNNGKNFPELHTQIMTLKSWLRGIYHHCSAKHAQRYLNEYCFRFNRRQFMDRIFHKLVERMVEKPHMSFKECSISA